MSTDEARIAARYPKSSPTTRLIVVVGIIGTVVGLAWMIWAGLFHANPAIVARVDAFTITSDATAEATVTVQRNDKSVAGTCLVIAQAVSFERVAEFELRVPAGEPLLQSYPIELKTIKRATSVSVEQCRPA